MTLRSRVRGFVFGNQKSLGCPVAYNRPEYDITFLTRQMAGLLAVIASSTSPPESVYWISNPSLPGETLVVAGAGLGNASARFCSDTCSEVVSRAWEQSVQVVVPSNVSAPTYVHIGPNVLVLNGPEIWWAAGAAPHSMRNRSSMDSDSHPKRINASLTQGEELRLFGRSLAWGAGTKHCISASSIPGPVPSTVLSVQLDGKLVNASAIRATCYEATFQTTLLSAGNHTAFVSTPWGTSSFGLSIAPRLPSPEVVTIDVPADFDGDLVQAVAHAASLDSKQRKIIRLRNATYTLNSGITLPPTTTLLGDGPESSRLVFSVDFKPPTGTCSPPQHNVDFYNHTCTPARGDQCFQDLKILTKLTDPYPQSLGACCQACADQRNCNALTFEGEASGPRGFVCILKECISGGRCMVSSSASDNKQSAFFHSPQPDSWGGLENALTAATDSQLLNFSLEISEQTNVPMFGGVFMPATAQRFLATGLNITMLQDNVSNAFDIRGHGFEILGNKMAQVGLCKYPNYGPGADRSPFQQSVTIYLENSRDGLIKGNSVFWRCSAFDLDVSDRVVFEDNNIICTEPHVVPHGNSISGYKWTAHPSSRWWSVSRNTFSRPPFHVGDEQNWRQRETLTTDGSGGFATGMIVRTDPDAATVTMEWQVWTVAPVAGTTLVVLKGPGTGQSRIITRVLSNTTLELNDPFDAHVGAASLASVVSSFGRKIVAGNRFTNTEVVQWYGNTLHGVHADNHFQTCNVAPAGGDGLGALQGVGECYHGSGPMFFTEIVNNKLVDSDGITLRDNNNDNKEPQCSAFRGPWIRWVVVRRNALSGFSNISAAAHACANVTLLIADKSGGNGFSTDVVAELTEFGCPNGGFGGTYQMTGCQHCVAGSSVEI